MDAFFPPPLSLYLAKPLSCEQTTYAKKEGRRGERKMKRTVVVVVKAFLFYSAEKGALQSLASSVRPEVQVQAPHRCILLPPSLSHCLSHPSYFFDQALLMESHAMSSGLVPHLKEVVDSSHSDKKRNGQVY